MAGTVVVGCKLPNGIILEIGGKQIIIKGANASSIIGGHGLTDGVDKDLFDAWMEKNKDLQFVREGFIFSHAKVAEVKAEAQEKSAEATGLEPLDPGAKPAGITEVE